MGTLVSRGALASDGVMIPLDNTAQALSYTGTVLDYVSLSYNGSTYRQTYTYTGGNLTTISIWTKQ